MASTSGRFGALDGRVRRLVVVALACVVGFAAAGWGGWLLLKDYRRRETDRRVADQAELIRKHAHQAGLPEALVRAVVRIESGGDPRAVSPKGARGLMQITPPAEKEMLRVLRIERGDLFDPDYNLRIGTGYLRRMVRQFDGDLVLALAAYNMGPTRTRRVRRQWPELTSARLIEDHAPGETSRYVRAILAEANVGSRLPLD